jgi:hypothetical protein
LGKDAVLMSCSSKRTLELLRCAMSRGINHAALRFNKDHG